MVNLLTINPLTQATLEFSLQNKIGQGGEGEVYLAFDSQLRANLAIKRISIAGKTPKEIDAFFDESRKLYLAAHPNVVPVNYGCKDNDYIYISMPFYKNGSLKHLMANRFLTTREVVRYSLQFLSGVNNIHTKKLIHFDIKPENILISDADDALVSDFGLAQFHQNMGFADVLGTTVAYAPPEFFSQAQHNVSFDIYQSGLVLYRMCNGDIAFTKQVEQAEISKGIVDRKHLIDAIASGRFPNRDYFLPHVSLQLKKIIKKALATNPADRYGSILAILNDLSKLTTFNQWQCLLDANGDEGWIDGSRKVNATKSNGTWSIFATKNSRRNNDYVKAGLTDEQKHTLLHKCLNEIW